MDLSARAVRCLALERGDLGCGDALYIVASGSVRVITGTDRRVVLAILEERDYFGEMALLDSGPRSATVEIQSETKLYVIKRDDFQRLFLGKPRIALSLFSTLIKRLRDSNLKILESQM